MEDDTTHEEDRFAFEAAYRPLRATDIVHTTLTPPRMLIADLVRSQSLVLVSGEPFTGKTMFLLSVALSLDTEMPLMGIYIPARHQRVLFVGQDAPTWDYFGQISALARGYSDSNHHLTSTYVLNRGLALGHKFRRFVSDSVGVYGTNVLMLDVLKSFHDEDENSNVAMSKVMDLLKAIRDEHGMTIFVTHHTSKPYAQNGSRQEIVGNYRARGASVIAGSIDQHFLLTQNRDAIQLSMVKARGGSNPIQSMSFRITSDMRQGQRTLRLVPFIDGRQTNDMTLRNAIASHLSSLTKRNWSLRDLFDAIRSEIRFSHLNDAQLYNRIEHTLRILQRERGASRTAEGFWSI